MVVSAGASFVAGVQTNVYATYVSSLLRTILGGSDSLSEVEVEYLLLICAQSDQNDTPAVWGVVCIAKSMLERTSIEEGENESDLYVLGGGVL